MTVRAVAFSVLISRVFGGLFVVSVALMMSIWYFGFSAINLPGAYQQTIDEAAHLVQLRSAMHAEQIGLVLKERRGDMVVAGEGRLLTSGLARKAADVQSNFSRIFERLQRSHPDAFEAMTVIDTEGVIRASNDPLQIGHAFPHADLMQRALQPGIVDLLEQAIIDRRPVLVITRQIFAPTQYGRPTGEATGALLAYVNLDQFADVAQATKVHNSRFALLDQEGTALVGSQPAGATPYKPGAHTEPGFEGLLMQSMADGKELLVSQRYIPLNGEQGWTLVHYVAMEDVLSSLKIATRALAASSFVLCLLGLWFGTLLARRLTRPLERLTTIVGDFGAGRLDQRIEVARRASQEIALLATTFNTMAERIQLSHRTLESAVEQRTKELVATRDELLATLDALPDLLFEVDAKGQIFSYHSNSHDLVAIAPEVFLGKAFSEVLPSDAADMCHAAIREADEAGWSRGRQYMLRLGGRDSWFEASVARKGAKQQVAGGGRFVFLARDISLRKHAEDEVRKLAFFDPLTNLPNRRLMIDRLNQARASGHRHGCYGALLLIDLDHFKDLNDSRGHESGDQLLVQAAQRFLSSVRECDTVARLGGDEFVVILCELDSQPGAAAMQAEYIAEKLRRELGRPYLLVDRSPKDLAQELEGAEFSHQITLSIGVSLFANDAASADELLKRADTAMYQAKKAGRNAVRFFDPEMQGAVVARIELDEELRTAVARQQFVPYFQPQVDTNGRCIGAELLIRWNHPRRGMVAPVEFISAMEDSGLILPLGHWILDQACQTLARWATIPALSGIALAVNVSARQIGLPTFVDEVLALLRFSGAPADRLKIELTESLLIDQTEVTIEKMLALQTEGVSFSLDDFGTGYSSLSYLKRLPLNQLKIDRSFVRDVLDDPNDAAIAGTVVALGRSLGLGTIAEGVESPEQRDVLARLGCQAYQGFLFGKPQPLGDFESWALGRTQ